MNGHLGFADQSNHYFARPSSGIPDGPVANEAAWRRADLQASPERWSFDLGDTMLDELATAATTLVRSGVRLRDIDSSSAALDSWQSHIERWRDSLASGLGVVRLRGIPVREWGDEVAQAAYWLLGHHLGRPGAQNPAGDLLGHVTDERRRPTDGLVRLYRTADHIAFHCDAADVVGLLCRRAAVEGGQSRIASSVAVFDELVRREPHLVPELFEPFDIDRRDEERPGERPTFRMVPSAWDGSTLRTFWHSDYTRSAWRHEGVEPTARRLALVERYDAIAAETEMHYDMWLAEGDIQLISNHTVVHSRTAYVDSADADERRHLWRLWLSLD